MRCYMPARILRILCINIFGDITSAVSIVCEAVSTAASNGNSRTSPRGRCSFGFWYHAVGHGRRYCRTASGFTPLFAAAASSGAKRAYMPRGLISHYRLMCLRDMPHDAFFFFSPPAVPLDTGSAVLMQFCALWRDIRHAYCRGIDTSFDG